MHDPFAWSVPLGRLFGITIRVHWLFPFVALAAVLSASFPRPCGRPEYQARAGPWLAPSSVSGLLSVAVPLQGSAPCLGPRPVDGAPQEALLGPGGGLAAGGAPPRPRAHFIPPAAGPAVN